MSGRKFEEKEKIMPLVGETPEERRTEAILRRAAVWEPEKSEPVRLAHRALTRRGILWETGRRPFIARHWWSMGTLGAAAGLAALVYLHPLPFDLTRPDEPTPAPQRVAQRDGTATAQRTGLAATEKTATPPTTKSAAPSPATQKKEAVPPNALKNRVRNPRPLERRAPKTTYQPRHSRYLAYHSTRFARWNKPKSSRSSDPTRPTAKTQVASSAVPAGATPDPAPALKPSDYRILVPVVLTHESEDGSEIISTPAVVELAYN